VVLIIIGLLVVLAVPKFDSVVNRTKMTEAKLMLGQIYSLEHSYYLEHDRYTDNLDALGFQQEKLITKGGKARYQISVQTLKDTGFVAYAEAVVDYDKDGTMNKWTIDHHENLQQTVPD